MPSFSYSGVPGRPFTAPGNGDFDVFPKNENPVRQFLQSLDVSGHDSSGVPVGSTGGQVHVWNDDVRRLNDYAGGNVFGPGGNLTQPTPPNSFLPGTPSRPAPVNAFLNPNGQTATPAPAMQVPSGNAFLRSPGTTAPTASPMAANTFIGGANEPSSGAPTGQAWINKAPGTRQANQDGSTTMLGRGSPVAQPSTPLSNFGSQVAASSAPISRNGAIYRGGPGGLSIAQDPNTIPAQGDNAAEDSEDPLVNTRFTQLMSSLAEQPALEGDAMQAIATAAQNLKTQVPNWTNLSEQEQTAILADDQRIRDAVIQRASRLAAQGMLPNSTQRPEVRANRMNAGGVGNAFLDVAGARDAVSGKPREVTVGGERYVQYGNGQLMRVNDKPERTLVAGAQRTLEPLLGVKVNAEWDGRDWIDSKSGAQVWITPRDSMGNVTGNPILNPTISGGQGEAVDPLDNLGGGTPAPKKTDEKPRVKLTLKDLK